MKKINVSLSVICILLITGATNLKAQTAEEGLKLRPFGLGLHVEQFRLIDLYTSDNLVSTTNNILFVFNAGQHFRIEPEIGIISYRNEDYDNPSTGISVGSGLFGMFNKKDVNFYLGLRVNYSRAKIYDYDGDKYIYTTIKVGPTIGAEYYFSPHFSFGGEIGFKYAALNMDVDEDSQSREDNSATHYNTETGLFVRFFF